MPKLDIFLFSDNCLNYNFQPPKDEMKNNNSEAERMKAKFEKQLMSLRDEKAKIQQSLSEARIRNEQIEELKKTIEIDQKEKNELGRQVLECKNRL
jgi:predicted RNase H-like nuclease (RuvC/YqgF family)